MGVLAFRPPSVAICTSSPSPCQTCSLRQALTLLAALAKADLNAMALSRPVGSFLHRKPNTWVFIVPRFVRLNAFAHTNVSLFRGNQKPSLGSLPLRLLQLNFPGRVVSSKRSMEPVKGRYVCIYCIYIYIYIIYII